MLEHRDPDSELIHEIKKSHDIAWVYFAGGGENDMHEHLLGDPEMGGSDYEFTDQETRMLSELHRAIHSEDDYLVITSPNVKNIKVGDTVEAKVNLPQKFADKYGISLTPKKVKVQKIAKHDN